MKFWEKFSRSIFKLAACRRLSMIHPEFLEPVLKKSVVVLDDELVSEIRSDIINSGKYA